MSDLIEALKERARLSLSNDLGDITRSEEYAFALGWLVSCLPLELNQELTARLEKENQADKALA